MGVFTYTGAAHICRYLYDPPIAMGKDDTMEGPEVSFSTDADGNTVVTLASNRVVVTHRRPDGSTYTTEHRAVLS